MTAPEIETVTGATITSSRLQAFQLLGQRPQGAVQSHVLTDARDLARAAPRVGPTLPTLEEVLLHDVELGPQVVALIGLAAWAQD
jgi:hypothetical protein